MPFPIVPVLLLGLGGGVALAMSKHGSSAPGSTQFPNMPPNVANALAQQIATQNDPAKLRLLATSARQTAALMQATNPQEAADYLRAAALMDQKAQQLEQAGGAAVDPIAQATNIMTQAGPAVAAQVPGIISQAVPPGATPIAMPPPSVIPTVVPPFVPQPVAAPPFVMPQPPPAGVPTTTVNIPGIGPTVVPSIPGITAPAGPAPTAALVSYKIASGDYAGVIAQRFGTTLSALAGVNPGHTNWNLIYPGQVLNLPAGAHDLGPRTHATGSPTIQAVAA